MNEKFKYLSKNLKKVFDVGEINKIAKDIKFIKRKGNVTAEDFLIFNIFYGDDLCKSSLSLLASKYYLLFDTPISKQALDKRFNEYSVEFMKEIFNKMIYSQNTTLKNLESTLNLHFDRVIINDSTSFILPEEFKDDFPGSGGVSSSSAIKIQLQYELLSGSFMRMDVFKGIKHDAEYLNIMEKDTENKDLKLADLGYFKIDYLRLIDENGSSFISKVKCNTALYIKNPTPEINTNGDIKKSSEYIKIDILELAKPLAQGETIELKDIYIGSKKELKSRLIVTKLTEENKAKREINHKENIRKKRGTLNPQKIGFNSINAYITNVPIQVLEPTQVHELYTLRWQIEIMFKVWKSIFKINQVKKVKIERFKCFLYGRLIALLLSSSIVFTAKNIIIENENKEISEIKAFGALAQYLPKLALEILKGERYIIRSLKKIILNFKRLCIKTRKKNKKTTLDILEFIKLKTCELKKFAI